MRTSRPSPSFIIQLMAALAATALRAPTPTAVSSDWVAKLCIAELKKRCAGGGGRGGALWVECVVWGGREGGNRLRPAGPSCRRRCVGAVHARPGPGEVLRAKATGLGRSS
jgi:hypothetical protein